MEAGLVHQWDNRHPVSWPWMKLSLIISISIHSLDRPWPEVKYSYVFIFFFLRIILRTFYTVSLLFPRKLSFTCAFHNLLVKSPFIDYCLSSLTLFCFFTCTMWITSPRNSSVILCLFQDFWGKIKLTCL